MSRRVSFAALALVGSTLAACSDNHTAVTAPAEGVQAKFTAPPPAPSNMPTTAPAPGVIYRESFGFDNQWRPTGGKGTLKAIFLNQSINGFWAEWPNSKNVAWIDGDVGESWKWAACSLNDTQMPSPIDVAPYNGCVFSGESGGMTLFPSALLPITAPATSYELSADGYPRPVPGAYLAIGFTSIRATSKALANNGSLWLRIDNSISNPGPMHYELRMNGMTGPVLASGNEGYPGFNPMSLRVDPVARTVTLRINGVTIGTYPATIPAPSFIAIEGYGLIDNVVVRK